MAPPTPSLPPKRSLDPRGPSQRPPVGSEKSGLGALAALVVGLGLIVWAALAGRTAIPSDAASVASASGSGSAQTSMATSLEPQRRLKRLAEASCELAVLTSASEAELARVMTKENIARLLDVEHCGGACDEVKKMIARPEHFDVEVMKTADYILPPKESYATIARELSPSERASIDRRAATVVVRSRGPATIDQLPARTAFAATAVLAEALSGLVYDEVVRRIETPSAFAEHGITSPLGQNVFRPRQIQVQMYRDEDGTAHLLTLGMMRFGSPDFVARGGALETGPAIAGILDAAARYAAGARTELPLIVTAADVARASRDVADTDAGAASGKAVFIDVDDAERSEGDPENEILELHPRGGWTSATTTLFGEAPAIVHASPTEELGAIAARARRDLPLAVKRQERGEGTLFVKGPFEIPVDSRTDGGPNVEWMWIEVTSCDARSCAGTLSNAPGYATNLAPGRPVRVLRDEAADWVLRLRDGGTLGGESIRLLQRDYEDAARR